MNRENEIAYETEWSRCQIPIKISNIDALNTVDVYWPYYPELIKDSGQSTLWV